MARRSLSHSSMKAAVRQSDTVCRQGGDEFVVLLPGLDGPQQSTVVARKVLAVCQAPFDLQGHEVRVGLSAGLALFPQHGSAFEELARHADTAPARRAERRSSRADGGGGHPAMKWSTATSDSAPLTTA